jgi:DNA-binding XRE family transcriptional regulator
VNIFVTESGLEIKEFKFHLTYDESLATSFKISAVFPIYLVQIYVVLSIHICQIILL